MYKNLVQLKSQINIALLIIQMWHSEIRRVNSSRYDTNWTEIAINSVGAKHKWKHQVATSVPIKLLYV
jgi:hypothetical protein